MQIVRQATIIYCRDIIKSRRFYENILGFTVDQDFTDVVFYKEGVAVWEISKTHRLSMMLGEGFYVSDGKPFEIYFEVSDFDDFLMNLEGSNVDYLHVTHLEPWGQRTVRFLDPDLNIVEVAEALELFISRLFENGKSVEEIARMNGLDVSEVKKILDSSKKRKLR
jgi:catechol 2,3-dioxygenase-like lactoylglutathione lyase family enzyme